MSSYIRFVFDYLFQPSEYLRAAAELERTRALQEAANLTLSANGSLLGSSSSGSSLLNDLAHAPHLQQTTRLGALANGQLTNLNEQQSACLSLSKLLASENRTISSVRSFIEFESILRHSINSTLGHSAAAVAANQAAVGAYLINDRSAATLNDQAAVSGGVGQATSAAAAASLAGQAQSAPLKRADLFECFNQLQLQDYYNGYDMFVGLRTASTLTILFMVFMLFVIYKTGCRENSTSRSQLQLSSSASSTKDHHHKRKHRSRRRREQVSSSERQWQLNQRELQFEQQLEEQRRAQLSQSHSYNLNDRQLVSAVENFTSSNLELTQSADKQNSNTYWRP